MTRFTLAKIAATLALAGTAGHSAAHAQQATACVPAAQAEALFVNVMPGVLGEMQRRCGPTLPAGALLRELPASYLAQFESAADQAWPEAVKALTVISGAELGMAEASLVRPMLQAMIGPMILKDVKTEDCPRIDKLLTAMRPLPPSNLATVVVTILQMRNVDKKSKLPVCAA